MKLYGGLMEDVYKTQNIVGIHICNAILYCGSQTCYFILPKCYVYL